MDDRLPTWLWIDALARRAQTAGAALFVLQKGDRDRGSVLVKVATLDGQARVYSPGMGMDGDRVFVDLSIQGVGPDEAGVDAYVARTRQRDSDIWVVEIEDKDGRHFLTEPVETGSD